MKIKLTFLFVMFCTVVFSQMEFAPIGAEWYYTNPDDDGNPFADYEKFEIIKDTVVDGKLCKVIGSQLSSEIMYEEDGKVFYWFKNDFKLIYDFTANVGDTIEFELKSYSPNSYVIDTTYKVYCMVTKIESEVIDNMELKKFFTSVLKHDGSSHVLWPSYYDYQERIGFEYEFINIISPPSFDGPNTLRCYLDLDISYSSDWWKLQDRSCDYKISTGFLQMEFAPVGAEWYFTNPNYSYSPPSASYLECVHYKSVKDTIINQKSCKKIMVSYCSNENKIGDLFLHQSKDSIFYFNDGHFYLLYDFSAKQGDTIVVHNEKFKPIDAFLSYNDSIDFFKYTILQVDSIKINGDWYKRQYVSSPRNSDWVFWGSPGYIIEKLGSTNYFLGRLVYTYPEQASGMLRCYYDDQIDYKDDDWEMECDFLTSNKQIILQNEDITLFPNPVNDILYLDLQIPAMFSKALVANIYNINGVLIQHTKIEDLGKSSINVSKLKSGVYFIELYDEDKSEYLGKFVKK